MRNLMKLMIVCFMVAMATNAAAKNPPIGVWKTIDDINGKPKAIIEISETPNQTLEGRILKVFSQPGQVQKEFCTACEGKRHNQRIIGLTILEHLKQNKEKADEWHDGEILDPKTGKIYHCNLRVTDNGQKLNVRGFIGLPLFGRTQTWIKVKDFVTA